MPVPLAAGVWKTTNCCYTSTVWTPPNDSTYPLNATAEIGALVIDPNNHNTIYAGTGGDSFCSAGCLGSRGVLKSTDAGASWSQLGMQEFITNSLGYPLRISALAVDPNNSSTVVAGTYAYGIGGAAAPITTSGVYLSANAGSTWNQCVITAPGMPTTSTQWISDLVLDNYTNPTTVYAAIGQSNLSGYDNPNPANGIYTATLTNSATNPCPLPANWQRILKTGDIFGGQAHPDFGRIKLARYNHSTLYTIIGAVDGGGTNILGVAETTNGGHSWPNQYDTTHFHGCSHDAPLNDPFSQPRLNLYVKVDPFFSNIVYAGIGDLFRSTDSGADFADQNCLYSGQNAIHQDQHAFAFRSGLFVSNIIFGNDGGLWSLDWTSPATLTNLNDTLSTLQMYAGDLTPFRLRSKCPGAWWNAGQCYGGVHR